MGTIPSIHIIVQFFFTAAVVNQYLPVSQLSNQVDDCNGHKVSSVCNLVRKWSTIADAELDWNVGWTITLLNTDISASLQQQFSDLC